MRGKLGFPGYLSYIYVFEWFGRLIKNKGYMMSPEEVYFAEQEFNRFEEIMNTKEYLTKEEYDFCFSYDKDIREDTTFVGFSDNKDYLNLRLYSEHDHEKRGHEMEIG